jgi:hypothetical protein
MAINHWVNMKACIGNWVVENPILQRSSQLDIIYSEAADRLYLDPKYPPPQVAHFSFRLYTCYGISLALKYPYFRSRLA